MIFNVRFFLSQNNYIHIKSCSGMSGRSKNMKHWLFSQEWTSFRNFVKIQKIIFFGFLSPENSHFDENMPCNLILAFYCVVFFNFWAGYTWIWVLRCLHMSTNYFKTLIRIFWAILWLTKVLIRIFIAKNPKNHILRIRLRVRA